MAPEGKERQPFRGAYLAKSPVRKQFIKRRSGGGPQPGQDARRPPTETELDVLMDVFGLALGSGLHGIACHDAQGGSDFSAVSFITPSVEISAEQETVPLDDHQLASCRRVYFIPTGRQIVDPCRPREAPPSQNSSNSIKRLLHPRARALFDGFGAQWLRVTDGDARFLTRSSFL